MVHYAHFPGLREVGAFVGLPVAWVILRLPEAEAIPGLPKPFPVSYPVVLPVPAWP
jgi:hypothetical protein